MKHLRFLSALLLTLTFTLSCEQALEETFEEVKEGITEELSDPELSTPESMELEKDASQTVEERIEEIKSLYTKIQRSANQKKNCVSKSKTTMNYEVIEEGIPFENRAKKCLLEDELMYQQVTLNGYEWSETANFYFKDDQRFFTFVSGGAEAYGYEYRVYYDKTGEVIRVLLAENEYDGQEVSAPFKVTDEGRKKEILEAVAYAEKELNSLLDQK